MIVRVFVFLAMVAVAAAQAETFYLGTGCSTSGMSKCEDGYWVETTTSAGGNYKECTDCTRAGALKCEYNTAAAAEKDLSCEQGYFLHATNKVCTACTDIDDGTTCASTKCTSSTDQTCVKCNDADPGVTGVKSGGTTCDTDCATGCLECTGGDVADCTKLAYGYFYQTRVVTGVNTKFIEACLGRCKTNGVAGAGACAAGSQTDINQALTTAELAACEANGAVFPTGSTDEKLVACGANALVCAAGTGNAEKCKPGGSFMLANPSDPDCDACGGTGVVSCDGTTTGPGPAGKCNFDQGYYKLSTNLACGACSSTPTDTCHQDVYDYWLPKVVGVLQCTGDSLTSASAVQCAPNYVHDGKYAESDAEMDGSTWKGKLVGLPKCVPATPTDAIVEGLGEWGGTGTGWEYDTVDCDPGYFRCGDDCFACETGCATCYNKDHCLTAKDGYFVTTAGDQPVACDAIQNCATGSVTCTSAANEACSACKPGYFLSGGTCSATMCKANCAVCGAADACTTCKDTYTKNSDTGACTACAENLDTTNYGSAADDCPIDPVSKKGLFVDADANKLKACDATCATCTAGTAGDCVTCPTGRMLTSSGNKCLVPTVGASEIAENGDATACKDGYFLSGTSCKACRQYAARCDDAVTDTACKRGYWLDDAATGGATCTSCTIPKSTDNPDGPNCHTDSNCAFEPCNDGNSSTISDHCVPCSSTCKSYPCYNQTNCVKSIGCITNTSHPLFSYIGGARDCEIARNGSWVENQIVKNCTEDPNCASSDRTARCAGGYFKCVTPATGFYTNTDGKVLECYSGTPGEDSCGHAASCDDIECDDDDWMTGDEGVLGATDRCEYTVNGTMCTSDVIRCEVPKNIDHLKQITNALFNGKALDLVNGTQIAHEQEVTISCKAGFSASIASFKLKCNATAETIFLQWGIPSVAAEAANALPKCNANPPPCCDESAASSFGPVLLLLAVAAVFAA